MDTAKLQRYKEETEEAYRLLERVSEQARGMAHKQRFAETLLPEVWQQNFEALSMLSQKMFSYNNPSSNKPDPAFAVGMIAFLSLLGYGILFYIVIGTNAALLMFGLILGATVLTALLYSVSPSVRKMKQYLKDLELLESQRAEVKVISGQVNYHACASFLIPLVTWLKEEMKPNALLNLDVNTSNYKKSDRFRQTGSFGKGVSQYLFPYLLLKTRLADNTVLQLNIDYQISSQTTSKKSRSGKWKTKIKHKVRIVYVLQLKVARQRYGLVQNELPDDIKLKENEKYLMLRLKATDKTQNMDQLPDFNQIMKLAHKGYGQVKAKA